MGKLVPLRVQKGTFVSFWSSYVFVSTENEFNMLENLYPLVRGTCVPNLVFTGLESVLWLLDKTFHSNPLSLYDEKPVLVHLPIFDPIWAFYPLVRGTWVQNLGFNGPECVLWLLDKTFHSNTLSLND